MRKNFRIRTAALGVLLAVTLATNNCFLKGAGTTDDDVAILTVLTGALGLLSGNCASIVRTGTAGASVPYSYTVTGTIIPRGGCNESTIEGAVTTDINAAKTAGDAAWDAFTAVTASVAASCGTTRTNITNTKTAGTTTAIQARATAAKTTQATGANEGCTNAAVLSGAALSGTIFCSDDTEVAFFRNRRSYHVISNVYFDMDSSLSILRSVAVADANITDSAANHLRLMSTGELTVFKGNVTKTSLVAVLSGENACANAVVNATENAGYKTVLTALVGNAAQGTATSNLYALKVAALGVTAAQVQLVTEATTPALYCGYTFTYPTQQRGLVTGVPACPQTYPAY